MTRNNLDYPSWKDCKALASAIKPIYTAASAEAAQAELDAFEPGQWGNGPSVPVTMGKSIYASHTEILKPPPGIAASIMRPYSTNLPHAK